MLDTTRLTLFFFTALVILVTPGPAVLYIIARSVERGRLAGIVSTLGVGFGTMFHVAAAASQAECLSPWGWRWRSAVRIESRSTPIPGQLWPSVRMLIPYWLCDSILPEATCRALSLIVPGPAPGPLRGGSVAL